MSLTSASHSFVPARKILDEIDLANRVRAQLGEMYSRVAIGLSGAINHHTLPTLTRGIRTRHPRIKLNLRGQIVTGDTMARLREGSLDLRFVGLPPQTGNMRWKVISEEPMGVAWPTNHRLSAESRINLAMLTGDDFVATPTAPRSVYGTFSTPPATARVSAAEPRRRFATRTSFPPYRPRGLGLLKLCDVRAEPRRP